MRNVYGSTDQSLLLVVCCCVAVVCEIDLARLLHFLFLFFIFNNTCNAMHVLAVYVKSLNCVYVVGRKKIITRWLYRRSLWYICTKSTELKSDKHLLGVDFAFIFVWICIAWLSARHRFLSHLALCYLFACVYWRGICFIVSSDGVLQRKVTNGPWRAFIHTKWGLEWNGFGQVPVECFFFRWCLMPSDVGWHITDKDGVIK